jgi:hypothetical protein
MIIKVGRQTSGVSVIPCQESIGKAHPLELKSLAEVIEDNGAEWRMIFLGWPANPLIWRERSLSKFGSKIAR